MILKKKQEKQIAATSRKKKTIILYVCIWIGSLLRVFGFFSSLINSKKKKKERITTHRLRETIEAF